MILEDGTGKGYNVKVDELNRLHTNSVVRTVENFGATDGYTFNINTGPLTLTSGNESAIFYLKNNGDDDLYISAVGYLLGNSTGGAGDLSLQVIRNPTAGTIVSGASPVSDIANKNFGSNRTLTVDAYKGGEGSTMTDGSVAYQTLLNSAAKQYVIATGNVVLPKGASIGVKITPQAGNTNMDMQLFLAILDSNGFDK